MVFRSFGFSVPIGWTASEPFAAFSLQLFHGANLPARVLCVQLVRPVADRVKIVAAFHRRIHAIVHRNEPHVLLREINLHVVADLQVLTPQPGGILYNQGGDLPGFDHFHDLFPTRPLKICSGIPVIRKEQCVFKPLGLCVAFKQFSLVQNAVRFASAFILLTEPPIENGVLLFLACHCNLLFCEASRYGKASIPHRLAQVYENLTRCALLFSVPHQCMRAACPLPSQTALPEIQT